MEIELDNAKLGIEYRPRLGSAMVTLSLGQMFIWDRLTEDTVFPCLIHPPGFTPPSSTGSSKSSALMKFVPSFTGFLGGGGSALNKLDNEDPLFTLKYEVKPLDSNVDYR